MDPSFLKRRMWEDLQPKIRRNFSDRSRSSTQRSSRCDWERPRNPKIRVQIPEKFQNSFRPENFEEKKKNLLRRPQMNENTAAVKIQAVFRGFLIRKTDPLKNLKAIVKLKASMEEIRQRINNVKVVELMRQNEKERLKMTEDLMSLLLKLDAIQGANTFVRESRKSVIRELLKLQEIVDAIITDKPGETEATTTSNAEESASHTISPDEHVDMHIDGAECNAVSSPDAQMTSLENKTMLYDSQNEHSKVAPIENPEPDKEDPEKKEVVSPSGNENSSNPSTESLKDSWEPSKEFSNNISVVDIKQNPEPVKDAYDDIPIDEMQKNPEPAKEFSHDVPIDDVPKNPDPENDSFSDDHVEESKNLEGKFGEKKKIVSKDSFNNDSVTKQQTTSIPTQMESSDSLSRIDVDENLYQITSEDHEKCSEKDTRSANNDEIHQLDDFNNLDQMSRDDAAIDAKEFDDEKSSKEKGGSDRMKKVMEDLYHRNKLQTDIIENIQKKLEKLEKNYSNGENAANNKRKRLTPDNMQ